MVLNPILETVANCWFESSSDYKKIKLWVKKLVIRLSLEMVQHMITEQKNLMNLTAEEPKLIQSLKLCHMGLKRKTTDTLITKEY